MHFLTAAILLTSFLMARAYECSPDNPSVYYNNSSLYHNTTTATGDPSTRPPLTPSPPPPNPDTPSTTTEPAPPATSTPVSILTLATSLLPPDPIPTPIPTPPSSPKPFVIKTRPIRTVFITVTLTPPVTPMPNAQPAGSLPELASSSCDDDNEQSAISTRPSPIPPPAAPTLPRPLRRPTRTRDPSEPATATTAAATTPTATTGKRVWFLPQFTLDTAGVSAATAMIGPGAGEASVSVVLDTAGDGDISLGANTPADASVATAAVTATALLLPLSPSPLPSGPLRPSRRGRPSSAPLATMQEPVSASLRKRSPAPRRVDRLWSGTRGIGGKGRRQACRPCEEEGKVSCRGDVAVGVCEGGCVEVRFLGRGRGNECEDE